jgi:hypothetical protein
MKLTLNTHHHDILDCSTIISWFSFVQLTHPDLFYLSFKRGIMLEKSHFLTYDSHIIYICAWSDKMNLKVWICLLHVYNNILGNMKWSVLTHEQGAVPHVSTSIMMYWLWVNVLSTCPFTSASCHLLGKRRPAHGFPQHIKFTVERMSVQQIVLLQLNVFLCQKSKWAFFFKKNGVGCR